MQTLNWFKERVNKRVFRKHSLCTCKVCKEILLNGLIISDEEHAQYLFDMQFVPDLNVDLDYYDKNDTTI